jgi:hypothetical protein
MADTVGPFDSERDARAAAHVLGGPVRGGWSILSPEQRTQLLMKACADAGVSLGSYDERILAWLAGFEDGPCAVIAGLVSRANRET